MSSIKKVRPKGLEMRRLCDGVAVVLLGVGKSLLEYERKGACTVLGARRGIYQKKDATKNSKKKEGPFVARRGNMGF